MIGKSLLLFGFALIGGFLAFFLGLPMPFLFGGLIGGAGFVLIYENETRKFGKLHPYTRMAAVAITGTMIGASFSPDLLDILPFYWPSALAMLPFMLIAHAGCYLILRRLGGYSKVNAYWAGLPGGLVEAVLLGEREGADTGILAAQHFIRILCVVITVPTLFFLLTGEVVGSAAGESLSRDVWDIKDVVLIIVIGVFGLFAGRFLRLPAGHLMGPLLLSLMLGLSGVVSISVPPWALHLAQFVIGGALGSQFSGITRATLATCLRMGVITVAYMLCLAALFAGVLIYAVPSKFTALFISFAAGGLAEMSLIALSLNLSPVIVALHHLLRIFLTVWVGNLIYQRFLK